MVYTVALREQMFFCYDVATRKKQISVETIDSGKKETSFWILFTAAVAK